MTTYVGKLSAICQPTRKTQPFLALASIAVIRCLLPQLGVAPSGERLRG